jgi:membrane associated rhomboid family serine protease
MTWRSEWEEPPHRRFGFGGGQGGGQRFFAVAPLTRILVLLCIAVTLASAISVNWFGMQSELYHYLALSSRTAPWIYPFFTYVLPHSIYGPMHILVNMVALWLLGQELEVRLGRTRFATLFFGAAFLGALAHLLLMIVTRGNIGMLVGASGGIYALIFFIARESPGRPFFFFFFAVPARVLAFLLLVMDLYPIVFGGTADGYAHACHLSGAAFGWFFQRHPFDVFAFAANAGEALQSRREERARRRAADDDREMDRILGKIHEQGMPSLTGRERRFLEERSKNSREGRR